ncbi:MAG: hypothetical protein AB1489_23400, partial [Acidobacteriota bacterium]
MSCWRALQDFVEVLTNISSQVIAADHISNQRPATLQDLPAIVVILQEIKENPIGIGGLIGVERSGEQWQEITGQRSVGTLLVEIWSVDTVQARDITDALFQVIQQQQILIRSKGFVKLTVNSVAAIVETDLNTQGAERASKMVIEYLMI